MLFSDLSIDVNRVALVFLLCFGVLSMVDVFKGSVERGVSGVVIIMCSKFTMRMTRLYLVATNQKDRSCFFAYYWLRVAVEFGVLTFFGSECSNSDD